MELKDKEKLQRGYRLLLVLLCQIGIVLQYAIVFKIGKVGMLSCYYTMHSNFVVLAYFLYLLIVQPKRENMLIKGAVVHCIAITGLVYHFMLNGAMEAGVGAVAQVSSMDLWANTLVHYVVPIMTFVDYLLFNKKGDFKWYYPFAWLTLPLLYLVFIMARAELGSGMFAGFNGMSRYPYPFIDVDAYGWTAVLIMSFIMLAATVVLGYLIGVIDKGVPFMQKHCKVRAKAKKD